MIRGTSTDCILSPKRALTKITTNTIAMTATITMVAILVTLVAGVLVVVVIVVAVIVVVVVVHTVDDIDPGHNLNMLSFVALDFTQETPQSI